MEKRSRKRCFIVKTSIYVQKQRAIHMYQLVSCKSYTERIECTQVYLNVYIDQVCFPLFLTETLVNSSETRLICTRPPLWIGRGLQRLRLTRD